MTTTTTQRCSARVYDSHMGGYTCSRKGVLHEEGKLWCRQHAPSSKAARDKERYAKWQEQWAVDRKRHRLHAAAPALLDAARAALLQLEYLDGKYSETGSGNQVKAQLAAAIKLAEEGA